MDILHKVENCYSWHTATVHEPGFPLREELSFASTPGHHVDYLSGLQNRFDESYYFKSLKSNL